MPFDLPSLLELIKPILVALPRLAAAIMVLPIFPQPVFSPMLRTAIAISLSLVLYPRVAASMPPPTWTTFDWLLFIAKESLIGFMIGYAAGMVFWVFESLGHLIDLQTGTSNASVFDPFGGHESGPLGAYLMQFAIAVFVSLGGLYVLCSLLYESFRLWPQTSFVPAVNEALRGFALERLDSVVDLATRLAAPVVLILVVVELAIGLVNRVAPQLNVFHFSMPIKGALAVLMLVLLLAHLVDILRGEVESIRTLADKLDPVMRQRP